MSQKFHFICLLLMKVTFEHEVSSLSPPPQDPNWPGWWCGGSYYGEQGVKCAKILDVTATPDEAVPICAAQKRDGDLITPTLLVINSKEEEDLAISSMMWGAYLWEGGNVGVWVGPSTYRDSKLPPLPLTMANNNSDTARAIQTLFPTSSSNSNASHDTSPNLNTNQPAPMRNNDHSQMPGYRINSSWFGTSTRVRRMSDPWYPPPTTCGELRIDVSYQGSHGQPSGYGFNPSTVSWLPKSCYDRNRVLCVTRKLTAAGLLESLNQQKKELDAMTKKLDDANKEIVKLTDSHCGVDPRNRVECGWGGIKQWQCLQRGCCFDNTISGVKFCFKKVADRSKFI